MSEPTRFQETRSSLLDYARAEVADGRHLLLTAADAKDLLERFDALLAHVKTGFALGCTQCEGLPCPGCADTARVIAKAEAP